jgi:nucleoside-diphosphate-sugar epimerase
MDDVTAPDEVHRINVLGSKELARAAVARGVGRFVFISSISAIGYPDEEGIIDEGVECEPVTAYGRSKLAAEAELLRLSRTERLRVAILRPPTVYGHGERRNFLFLTRAVNTGLFLVPGTGDNRISFCNVKNLAQAVLFALENEGVHGLFHLADREVTTFRHVIEVIARVLGARIPPVPFPYPVALSAAVACEVAAGLLGRHPPLSRQRLKTLTRDFAFDGAALRARGFEPKAGFEPGVQATVEWYRSSGLIKRPHLLGQKREPPSG